jgi:hypothetical protein
MSHDISKGISCTVDACLCPQNSNYQAYATSVRPKIFHILHSKASCSPASNDSQNQDDLLIDLCPLFCPKPCHPVAPMGWKLGIYTMYYPLLAAHKIFTGMNHKTCSDQEGALIIECITQN